MIRALRPLWYVLLLLVLAPAGGRSAAAVDAVLAPVRATTGAAVLGTALPATVSAAFGRESAPATRMGTPRASLVRRIAWRRSASRRGSREQMGSPTLAPASHVVLPGIRVRWHRPATAHTPARRPVRLAQSAPTGPRAPPAHA